jgi:hypothetical protein
MKFTYSSGSRPLEGYTIKRGVGHGGFGEVYYAVSDGGKEVALKLVQRNLDVELRGVVQCMNLKHTNLVTIYDLRTNEAGEHFVVMEYVAGQSLADVLEAHPNGLPIDDANRWLRGIMAGVGYLHDKGIVHRDLKPGNLFMEDGVVKVGDYGLSKFITASRRSGQTESVGTVHYMAPEIASGKYDREIDVYALGVILYEMLTGNVPFDGESVGEILMKHLTAQPDVSKLPAPYDAVAARALAKEPTRRFRTMEEFGASLNGRLSHSPYEGLAETAHYAAGDAPIPPPIPPSNGAGATVHELHPTRASGSWFDRMCARFDAWWSRPWDARDYLVAFPLGVLIGMTAIPLAALGISLLPWALLGAGVVALVRIFLGPKRGRRPAAARPVVLPQAKPVTVPQGPPAGPRPAEPPRAAPAPRGNPTGFASANPPVTVPVPVVTPVRAPAPLRPIVPRVELPPKPVRERLTEGITAMLLTTVLSVLAAVLVGGSLELGSLEGCAMLAATCVASCWAVLVPAKLWEGAKGDPLIRRLVMAALGFGVGAGAGYLDAVLQTHLFPADSGAYLRPPAWIPPEIAGAGYLALVFGGPSWWCLADSRRSVRFNPWLAVVPCFAAWVFSHLWTFPQPFGIVATGIVAVLVQVASPWDGASCAARNRVA